LRQLRYTVKRLNRLAAKGITSKKLEKKLERQWNFLNRLFNTRSLARLLSGVTLILVLGDAQGQASFQAPVWNPWSYNPAGSNRKQSIAVVDLDNDGDFDIIISDPDNEDYLYYENIGSATTPLFTTQVNSPFGLSLGLFISGIHFADLDSDADLDVLTASYNWGPSRLPEIAFQENTGTASAPAFSPPVVYPFGISSNSMTHYTLNVVTGDFDNDGDLDMTVVEEISGVLLYFQNTGSPSTPDFSTAPQRNFFGPTPNNTTRFPAFVDLDNDGDLDVLSAIESSGLNNVFFEYIENTGTASIPSFGPSQRSPFNLQKPNINSYYLGFAAADMDGDGDVDLFLCESGGELYYYENTPSITPVDPTIQFAGSRLTASEPTAGTLAIDLGIINPNANPTSIDIRLGTATTATIGADFSFTNPRRVVFPAGSGAPVSVNIPILDDALVEPNEVIVLELVNPTNNAKLGSDSVFTITIVSEDVSTGPPELNFNISSDAVYENQGSYQVTATLSSPSAQQIEVSVASGPSTTAVHGQDYTLSVNKFVFPANSTAPQSITINLIDDNVNELDEVLSLMMINPTSGIPIGNTGTFSLEILNDDYAVGLNALKEAHGLTISPNPASDFVEIRMARPALLRCTLMNMEGKLLKQLEVSSLKNRLDMSEFTPGIYLLHVEGEEHSGHMKLLVR
jgi:hypothetical protein